MILKEITVKFGEDTLEAIDQVDLLNNCGGKANAVSFAARLTASILKEIQNGGTIQVRRTSGEVAELVLDP